MRVVVVWGGRASWMPGTGQALVLAPVLVAVAVAVLPLVVAAEAREPCSTEVVVWPRWTWWWWVRTEGARYAWSEGKVSAQETCAIRCKRVCAHTHARVLPIRASAGLTQVQATVGSVLDAMGDDGAWHKCCMWR